MGTPKTITIDDTEYIRADSINQPAGPPTPLQIVVADRGWVFIGRAETDDEGNITLTGAQNIRYWGTSGKAGLGHLANHGPTDKTKLDDYGVVRVPVGSIISTIDANESKWKL